MTNYEDEEVEEDEEDEDEEGEIRSFCWIDGRRSCFYCKKHNSECQNECQNKCEMCEMTQQEWEDHDDYWDDSDICGYVCITGRMYLMIFGRFRNGRTKMGQIITILRKRSGKNREKKVFHKKKLIHI